MNGFNTKKSSFIMNSDLKIYIDSISKYQPLPKNEIYNLGIRKNLGDAEARQKLINHHLLYVVSIATNYFIRYPTVDPLDIIQYGNEGLIKAVDKYNPKYAALTTYSKDWIEETIERMLGIAQSDLTTPVDVQFKAKKYTAIMKKALYNNETPPSDEELLEILKVSENGLNRIKEYANTTFVSMNKVVNDYDGKHDTELSDFIADKNVKNPEDTINKVDDFELLITLKENLSPLHYYILYMRLLDNKPHSYRELSEEIGVEHTYIGVLEASAKKAATPFLAEDKEKMRKEVERIKLREKANFYKLNTKPLKPKEIIDYLYLKRHFDGVEREILKDLLLHKYDKSFQTGARRFSLTDEQYKKKLKQIISSTKRILSNTEDYNDFFDSMIRTYSTQLFSLDLEQDYKHIEYEYLKNRYAYMSFDEIKELYGEDFNNLPENSKKLLYSYFSIPKSTKLKKDVVERELNLTIFNYKNKDTNTPPSRLYRTYLKNKELFTEDQRLLLESCYFHTLDMQVFLSKYNKDYIRQNLVYLIHKLEKYHYGLKSIFWAPGLNKEMYIQALKKHKDKISSDKIEALNMHYGVECEKASVQEIANHFCLDYEKTRDFLRHARECVYSLETDKTHKKNINKNIYSKYIKNNAYELTDETRTLLKYHVIDDLNYNEIADITGLSNLRISNIINDGLRKIDFYRFGIIKPLIISKKELNDFFREYADSFSLEEKNIIEKRFLEHITVEEIANTLQIGKPVVHKADSHFTNLYAQFLIKNVKLLDKDIEREVQADPIESVLNEEERKALSLYYGIRYSENPNGEKYTGDKIAEVMNISFLVYKNRRHSALKKIKMRVSGLLEPENIYIDRAQLDEALDDIHLPISEKEKEIICYTCAIKGYPHHSFEELEKIYGDTKKSLKRRYQRAIVNIRKYLNREINGKIDYDADILINLRYFSKAYQTIIVDYYKDGLTCEAIAKKYNLSFDQAYTIIENIQANLYDIKTKKKRRFDFNYAELALDDPLLPFYGNIDLAKSIYYLAFNRCEEILSVPEIINQLDLNMNKDTVTRMIRYLMTAVSKLEDGIKKENDFIYDEILDYYNRHKDEFTKTQMAVYTRYFNRVLNNPTNRLNYKTNEVIKGDLLKEKESRYILLNNASRDQIILILKNRRYKFSKNVREALMQIFEIPEREFMSGQEINHVYRLLSSLDEIIKKKEQDSSLNLTSDLNRLYKKQTNN